MRARTAGGRWRRSWIRLLATALIGVLATAGWLVLHRPAPTVLSVNGQRLTDAMAPLEAGQRQIMGLVDQRHGVRGSDTRCYYLTSSLTRSDPVPIVLQLACGPVLFVDGDSSTPYVQFELRSVPAGRGRVRLEIQNGPEPTLIGAADPGRSFVRPDSVQPPTGSGGLSLPPAPAAGADLLTRTSQLGSPLTDAAATAVMIGRTSGVRLVGFGFVQRYGEGDLARSAPRGKHLLAFRVTPLPGDTGAAMPTLSVRVDGVERGPLVNTADYVVTAVPADATEVDLVLTDSGVTQTISLLNGQPGDGNPAVHSRRIRTSTVGLSKAVGVKVSAKGRPAGLTTGTLTLSAVSLTYWAADGSHAAGPNRALLHLSAEVKLAGDRQAYGADAALLSVTVDGRRLTVRNAAAQPTREVDDVVDVPADLTTATMTFAGTLKSTTGTVQVTTPVTIPFSIGTS